MEETENSKLMEAAHLEVEARIEQLDDLDDEALLDEMSARAVAWCQAIAEFIIPMEYDDEVLTTLAYDKESVVITVRRNASAH